MMGRLFYFVLYGVSNLFLQCLSIENTNKNNFLDSDRNRNLFLEVQKKVECLGCKPNKEELLEYYNWPNTLNSYSKNHNGEILKKYPRKDFICNAGDQEWYCRPSNRSQVPRQR